MELDIRKTNTPLYLSHARQTVHFNYCVSNVLILITLTDSNNTENIQQISICAIIFYQSDILRKYDLILSSLKFKTLYSRRRHLDALFLINIFKGKTNCQSILDTAGIRVPTRHIR
jgi:hypothetical protein